MPHAAAARNAARDRDAGRYQRHRPEQTLLYRIIEQRRRPALTSSLSPVSRVVLMDTQIDFVER